MVGPMTAGSVAGLSGRRADAGRLVSILREADEGAVDRAMALFEQMEEKDAHLHSVANTRRLALTGLGWQVVSAAEVQEGVRSGGGRRGGRLLPRGAGGDRAVR